MGARPRHFRLFVTPGTLRFNRFGMGNPTANFGVPPALSGFTMMRPLFSELWGEYSSGEPSVVAAANWTFNVATLTSITNGVNQITYPGNTTNFIAHTAAISPFNAGKTWELDFEFAVLGGSTTNNFQIFAEDDGSSTVGFGVIIQADGIDGNLNATLRAAGANVGVDTVISPTFNGDNRYRLTCDGTTKQLTLFLNGTQVLQGTPASHVPTGSKDITFQYVPSASGNSGFIGPIKFKGFAA